VDEEFRGGEPRESIEIRVLVFYDDDVEWLLKTEV
jgi:hypothetical protein